MDLTLDDMLNAPSESSFQLQDPGPLTPDENDAFKQMYGAPLPETPNLQMDNAQNGINNPQLRGLLNDVLKRSTDPANRTGVDHGLSGNPSYAAPAAPIAPRGTVLAKEQQTTVEGGPTPEQLATDTQVRGEADLGYKQSQADLLQKQAEKMAQRSGELKAEAAHEEQMRAKQEQDNQARMERLRKAQMDMRKQEDEPVDPNRYYRNMSIFGKVAAVLSAGIHGLLSRPGEGPAPVIKQLTDLAHEDTASQIDALNRNEKRRNGMIEQYQMEYGDATMAAQRLDADKLRIARKMLQAEDLDNQSQDVQMRRDDMVNALAAQEKTMRADILKSQWAHPVQVTRSYERPKPVGGGADLETMKKMLEVRGKQLENRQKELENKSDEDLQSNYGLARKDLASLEKYSDDAKPLEDMRVMGNRLAGATGLVRDESGHWILPQGQDARGVGTWDKLLSQTELSNAPDRDAAFLLYKGKLQNTLTGAAATEAEAKRISQMVDSMTEKNFVEKFNEIDGYFNDRLHAIPAPANVRAAYRKMQRESSQEKPVGVRPVTGRIPTKAAPMASMPQEDESQQMSVAP